MKKTPAKRGKGKDKAKGKTEPAPPKVEALLFDLDKDVAEATNVAASHPEIVEELTSQMQEYDAEITANAREPWNKPE